MQTLNKLLLAASIVCLINFTHARTITNQDEIQAHVQLNPGDTFMDDLVVNPNNNLPRNLDGANLAETQGNRLTLHNVTGTHINLARTTLPHLTITTPPATEELYYQLEQINFDGATIESLHIESTNLNLPSFRNATATGAVLQGESLYNAFFTEANLTDATINYTRITGLTTFVGATLRRTTIIGHLEQTLNLFGVTTLEGADLTGIPVTDLNRFQTIINLFLPFDENPDFNHGLRLPDGIRLTFFDSSFSPAQIARLRLRNVIMPRVVLPNIINNWHFDGAVINGTDFTGVTQARGATFNGTGMRGVILPENIDGWDFTGADLTNADFTHVRTGRGARFGPGTLLFGVDLTHLPLEAIRGMNFAGADLTNTFLPPILDDLILDRVRGILQIPSYFPYPRAAVQVSHTRMAQAYFDTNNPTIIILSIAPGTSFRVNATNSTTSGSSSLSFSDTDNTGGSYSANNKQNPVSDGKLPLILFLRSRAGNNYHGVSLNTIRTPSIENAIFN